MSGLAFDDIRRSRARNYGEREHAIYEREVDYYYSDDQFAESDRLRRKRNRLIAAMCLSAICLMVSLPVLFLM
jgi:hypothetical protein